MKYLALLLIVAPLAACSKSAEGGANSAAAQDPFIQKLQSLPESERAEYVRNHAAEAARSGGATPAPAPSAN